MERGPGPGEADAGLIQHIHPSSPEDRMVAEAVRFLVAGLPAEIVREIGLRLRGVAVTEFDDTQKMGRAASQGEAAVVILSDTQPTQDSIYIARRARDANEAVRIAYCISMAQAEGVLNALKEIRVDRFFLSPVDVEEMLRELAKMSGVEVLAPQVSHGDNVAAAVFDAWDRARASAFKRVDSLDDAAIALLDNSISADLKTAAQRDAQGLSELTAPFGFARASAIAREIADRFSNDSLTPVEGVAISEQLLALRDALQGAPQAPPAPSSAEERALSAATNAAAPEDSLEGSKILIVDDDPQITRALTMMLKRRGIAVTALNDPLRFWSVLDDVEAEPDNARPRNAQAQWDRAVPRGEKRPPLERAAGGVSHRAH